MRDTATMVNGFDMESVDALDPELRQIVKRRASLLGPAYKLFYANPVRIVRGEGVHLYDADGRAYLDAYNNVPSVGHCHPRVVEAIARQAATLNTHTRYASEPILDYAERLLGTYPAGGRSRRGSAPCAAAACTPRPTSPTPAPASPTAIPRSASSTACATAAS